MSQYNKIKYLIQIKVTFLDVKNETTKYIRTTTTTSHICLLL